jgi:hypothetical protein
MLAELENPASRRVSRKYRHVGTRYRATTLRQALSQEQIDQQKFQVVPAYSVFGLNIK